MKSYKKFLLFNHEMLYFKLPGLHKIMASFAKNKEIGIKEAVNHINHLYWFTFQQKQAQKAIIKLGKDKETTHQYIHFFNNEIIKTLDAAHKFLTSVSLKDFYEACEKLEAEIDFPAEIKYFRDIRHIIPQLKKTKNEMLKIESIERFDTKRSFMNAYSWKGHS